LYLSWSLKKEIYDVPNERSSHTTPTPRGGGLVIVLVCLFSYFTYLQITDQKIIWAYFLGALLVSIVSWIDDLYSLSIVWRFLCHSIAALLILFSYNFPATIAVPVLGNYSFAAIGFLFWFLWIVWLINGKFAPTSLLTLFKTSSLKATKPNFTP
jgi:UDP-N-acetylmuramyl pentapeptide phosphotransferase/UDP-N-acetylglucosamine-1-phosphate transferase